MLMEHGARTWFSSALLAAVLAVGCAGDDERVTSGLSGGYNPTATAPTSMSQSSSSSTSEDSSSGAISSSGEATSSSTGVESTGQLPT